MFRKLALVLVTVAFSACGGTKDFTFDAGASSPRQDAGPCDPFTQTNCDASLKCTIQADGTPVCGAKGSGAAYADCSVSTSLPDGGTTVRGDDSKCSAGTACLDLEFQGRLAGNHCYPFCDLDAQPTDGGTTCPGTNATCLDLHSAITQGFCDIPAPSTGS